MDVVALLVLKEQYQRIGIIVVIPFIFRGIGIDEFNPDTSAALQLDEYPILRM